MGNSDNFHDSAFTCFPSPSLLPRLSLVFPKILSLPPLVFFSSPSVLSSLSFFSQNAAFDCTGLDPRTPQPHSLPLPLSSASSPSLYLPPPQLTDNPMNESDERSETLREKGGEGEWERQHMYSPLVSLPLSLSLSLSMYPHHPLPPPPPTSNLQNSVPVHPEEEQREKIKQNFLRKTQRGAVFFLYVSLQFYASLSLFLSRTQTHFFIVSCTHKHAHTHRSSLPTTATEADSFNQSCTPRSFISSLFPSSLHSFFSLSQQCRARLSSPPSISPSLPLHLSP